MNTTHYARLATARASVLVDERENIRVLFEDADHDHPVVWHFTPALAGRLLRAVESALHEGRRSVGAGVTVMHALSGRLRLRAGSYDVTVQDGLGLEFALERAYHERRSTVGGLTRAEAEAAAAEGTPEGLAALEAWHRAGVQS